MATTSNSDYAVTLPVGEDQLREFLVGLLGRPQTISRQLYGPFKVTRSDIENINTLIDQRLTAQNNSMLASFIARIVYDDNSSVQLNSITEFQTYNETKPLRSQAIHLSWTYLVKFINKTQFEKQQIDLSISVARNARQTRIDAEFPDYQLLRASNRGVINLRISHSDRSWGSDIDSLLTGILSQFSFSQRSVRSWISSWSGAFGVGTFIALFVTALNGVYFSVNQISAKHIVALTEIEQAPPTIETISRSLNLLSRYLVGGGGGLVVWSVVFILLALIGSIALGVWVSDKATYHPRSFLIISRSDEIDYSTDSRETGSKVSGFVGSAAVSLILGVLSNILFYYVAKFLVLN